MSVNNTALKNSSSKTKHYMWIIFIISLLFPFNFFNKFSIYNYVDIYNIIDYDYIHSENVLENIDYINKNMDNYFYQIEYNSWHENGLKLWGVCFIIIILIKFLSYFIFKRKVGNNIVKSKRVNEIFERCKLELDIKRNIDLVIPQKYISPAIVGIFKLKIIVSKEIIELDDEKMKNIFMHELSHYRRRDNITYWILNILAVIYWFNPIIYFLIKSVRNSIEYSADEMATEKLNENERKEYCRTIITVAEISCNEVPMAIGFLRKNILDTRVKYILNHNEELNGKKMYMKILPIVSAVIIIVFFSPTTYSNDYGKNKYLKIASSESNTIQLEDGITNLTLNEGDYVIIWNNENINMKCINLENGEKLFSDYIILNLEKGEYIYKIDNNFINFEIK